MYNNVKVFLSVVGILILGVISTAVVRSGDSGKPGVPGKYDSFTECLKDKGAVFYGAFWCSHCQATKKLFGSSQKSLPYVECSTSNGQAMIQQCVDKKIDGYPTWEFADGSRLNGEIPLAQLAEKTSCELPK